MSGRKSDNHPRRIGFRRGWIIGIRELLFAQFIKGDTHIFFFCTISICSCILSRICTKAIEIFSHITRLSICLEKQCTFRICANSTNILNQESICRRIFSLQEFPAPICRWCIGYSEVRSGFLMQTSTQHICQQMTKSYSNRCLQ